MARPKGIKLLADELSLLFEDPMAALLDDAPLGGDGDHLSAVETVSTKGSAARPSEHRRRQLLSHQLARLLRHLRDVAVVVQARPQVAGLAHLHDVTLQLVLRDGRRVVGEVAKEMPKVLLLPALDQKTRDIHVHVHREMPVGYPRIDIAG